MTLSRRHLLGLSVAALAAPALATARPALKVGVLKFGTVSWLMHVIERHGLASGEGLTLEAVDLANNQAGTVALLADSVDLVVSDWPWALRQRAEGEDIRFFPYSAALGAVMVPAGSPVSALADLAGKRLGVAGSAIDKSWIMLRAHARQSLGVDLATAARPLYAAPPLLNEELRSGRLDGVLTYWNFAARLEGAGFRRALDMADVQRALGLAPPPPMVGFVWKERVIQARGPVLAGFQRAVAAANRILAQSDEAWEDLRPLMRAENEAEFAALKASYRAGIPGPWTPAETRSAEKLFDILATFGGAELLGHRTRFDAALFPVAAG